jgi:sortase A
MSKFKLLSTKLSIVKGLSLGFMILGIGCISWAMISIWSQSFNSYNSIPTTLVVKQNKANTSPEVDPNGKIINVEKVIYKVNPIDGDNIGTITMPTLKQKLPIIQGTGDKELKKGVGHYVQSVLPGERDNCVISGHRDTVFSEIGKLKIGDPLIIQTVAGLFTYEVSGTRIVKQDDRTVIVPTDSAVLTMTTCYPFSFIGSAPDRYIVSANLVENK